MSEPALQEITLVQPTYDDHTIDHGFLVPLELALNIGFQMAAGKDVGRTIYHLDNNEHAHRTHKLTRNKDGELNGPFTTHFKSTGRLREKGQYKDGQLDDVLQTYYNGGQLYSSATYKDGQMNGPFETFYMNGTTQSKGAMKDGKFIGDYEYRGRNGFLKAQGTYNDDGQRTGLWLDVDRIATINSYAWYEKGDVIAESSDKPSLMAKVLHILPTRLPENITITPYNRYSETTFPQPDL